jgi:hypothetical protein
MTVSLNSSSASFRMASMKWRWSGQRRRDETVRRHEITAGGGGPIGGHTAHSHRPARGLLERIPCRHAAASVTVKFVLTKHRQGRHRESSASPGTRNAVVGVEEVQHTVSSNSTTNLKDQHRDAIRVSPGAKTASPSCVIQSRRRGPIASEPVHGDLAPR